MADIAVFDLTGLHLGPVEDPLHALTLAGTSGPSGWEGVS